MKAHRCPNMPWCPRVCVGTRASSEASKEPGEAHTPYGEFWLHHFLEADMLGLITDAVDNVDRRALSALDFARC